jgi:hypothetical protein
MLNVAFINQCLSRVQFMTLSLEPASGSVVPASQAGSLTQTINVTNSLHGQVGSKCSFPFNMCWQLGTRRFDLQGAVGVWRTRVMYSPAKRCCHRGLVQVGLVYLACC